VSFSDRGSSSRGRDSNRGSKDSSRGGSRDSNRGGFRGGNSGPVDMHSAVCSDCGVETQVPFKPTEGRPVYCREYLPKHRKF
jgi:CxxC-x17-CxxC domain-containing protein